MYATRVPGGTVARSNIGSDRQSYGVSITFERELRGWRSIHGLRMHAYSVIFTCHIQYLHTLYGNCRSAVQRKLHLPLRQHAAAQQRERHAVTE